MLNLLCSSLIFNKFLESFVSPFVDTFFGGLLRTDLVPRSSQRSPEYEVSQHFFFFLYRCDMQIK